MTAVAIARDATAALEIAQWIRNGKGVAADLQNRLATRIGYAASVTTKCVGHFGGQLVGASAASLIPDSLATRKRWRFAWHSSPYASFIYIRFEVAPQNNGTATDPTCTLSIQDGSGTLIGTATIHAGSAGTGYADVPVNFGSGVAHLVDDVGAFKFIDPDTEYTGVFRDVGYARLHSASVWEVALTPNTDNGYPANNVAVGAPVLYTDRDGVRVMAQALHKRSGTPVFHWSSDLDSLAPSTTGTVLNLIDGTSTTVSDSTPGFTVDLTNHATLRTAADGVPVRLRVAAKNSADSDTGAVTLLDSTGTVLITVPIDGDTTEQWYEANGYLPAGAGKYDLQFGGNTLDTLTVFAASCYEIDWTTE